MKRKLTRRSFLKAAGTMAVAVSAAGLFAGCEEMPDGPDSGLESGGDASVPDAPSSAKILWTIQDNGGGTATLTGYDKTGPQPSGYVVIPSEVSGRTITSINANFGGCTGWTRVTIPGTVKTIQKFGYCPDMKVLDLGEGIEEIYSGVFQSWSGLTNVSFPRSLKKIYSDAFKGCENLRVVSFPDTLEAIYESAFYKTALEEVVLPAKIYVASGAFKEIKTLKRVVINTGATFGGRYGGIFENCTSLQQVVFNGSVDSLEESMFCGCSSLSDVKLPYGLKKINADVFEDCISLKKIELPYTVTEIGQGAFYQCKALVSVSGLNGSQTFGNTIFGGCTALEKIALPEGMQKIPAAMFHSCSNLRSIYIPVSVKVVESGAFNGCNNLKSVYYGGYLENWQAMYVKDNGSVLFNANVYGPCTASDLK